MIPHPFFFQPGVWQGKGTIVISLSPTPLHFTTEWTVLPLEDGTIQAVHSVKIEETDEPVINRFRFFDIQKSSFQVELSNNLIGMALGKGLIDEKTLGWEFREQEAINGFETLHLEESGGYFVHAEYASPDDCRSLIHAHLIPVKRR